MFAMVRIRFSNPSAVYILRIITTTSIAVVGQVRKIVGYFVFKRTFTHTKCTRVYTCDVQISPKTHHYDFCKEGHIC